MVRGLVMGRAHARGSTLSRDRLGSGVFDTLGATKKAGRKPALLCENEYEYRS